MSRSNDCWFWKNIYPRPLRQCRSRGMFSEKMIGKVQFPQFLGIVHLCAFSNQEVLNFRVSHIRDKECFSGCFPEIESSVLVGDIGSGFVLTPLSPDGNAEWRSLSNQRKQSLSLLCVSGVGQQANGISAFTLDWFRWRSIYLFPSTKMILGCLSHLDSFEGGALLMIPWRSG